MYRRWSGADLRRFAFLAIQPQGKELWRSTEADNALLFLPSINPQPCQVPAGAEVAHRFSLSSQNFSWELKGYFPYCFSLAPIPWLYPAICTFPDLHPERKWSLIAPSWPWLVVRGLFARAVWWMKRPRGLPGQEFPRRLNDLKGSFQPKWFYDSHQSTPWGGQKKRHRRDAGPTVMLKLLLPFWSIRVCLLLAEDDFQMTGHRTGFPLFFSVRTGVVSGHIPSGSGLCPAAV